MDYQFTVLTVSQQVTTRTTGAEAQAPWSNSPPGIPIGLPGAALSTITISDDDTRFQSGRYDPDLIGQTLKTDVIFGNSATPTPTGTQLSFHIASVISSKNADGTYDEFLALFPRELIPNATGPELGGRYAVLLMPVPRTNGTYPVFSLSRSYGYTGIRNLQRTNDSVAYAPPAAVTCFALGTMIDTTAGIRAVETLRPGDLILTRDHGPQVLRWQGSAHVTQDGLEMRPNLRPILIRKGALGAGSPARDLVVSPQHRILVRSRIAHRLFQDTEILVAAKHLVGLPGIQVTAPPEGVTYFHLLFDRHEILMSNGAWSESLYTGPEALKSVSDAARREIMALFPDLAQGMAPAPARRLLTGREAQQLAERQLRNIGKRSLVEAL
ncbi:Hint domain-containing protein [Paracoccus lichenicola]|nr:Hint domain-containing protein [Paracoccus lichenicola]